MAEDLRLHFSSSTGLSAVLSPPFLFLVQEEAEMAAGLISFLTSPFNWPFYVSSFFLGVVKVTLFSDVINCVTLLINLHFCNKSQKCQLECGVKSFCCPSVFACLFCGHCNYALYFLCLQGQGMTPASTLPFFGIAAPAVKVDIRYIYFPSNSSESREVR